MAAETESSRDCRCLVGGSDLIELIPWFQSLFLNKFLFFFLSVIRNKLHFCHLIVRVGKTMALKPLEGNTKWMHDAILRRECIMRLLGQTGRVRTSEQLCWFGPTVHLNHSVVSHMGQWAYIPVSEHKYWVSDYSGVQLHMYWGGRLMCCPFHKKWLPHISGESLLVHLLHRRSHSARSITIGRAKYAQYSICSQATDLYKDITVLAGFNIFQRIFKVMTFVPLYTYTCDSSFPTLLLLTHTV